MMHISNLDVWGLVKFSVVSMSALVIGPYASSASTMASIRPVLLIWL